MPASSSGRQHFSCVSCAPTWPLLLAEKQTEAPQCCFGLDSRRLQVLDLLLLICQVSRKTRCNLFLLVLAFISRYVTAGSPSGWLQSPFVEATFRLACRSCCLNLLDSTRLRLTSQPRDVAGRQMTIFCSAMWQFEINATTRWFFFFLN